MLQVAARAATRVEDAGRYQRHRPEQTLLYRIVEECCPAFAAHLAERGRVLPAHVQRDYLKCGRLEYGFLRVRCESRHAEHLVAFNCTKSRRFRRTPWLLPQLRGATHGGKCGAAGR